MKKFLIIFVSTILAIILVSNFMLNTLIGKYTCYDCKSLTSKAYYDANGNEDNVLCEDCARSYWMPLNIENFRVK